MKINESYNKWAASYDLMQNKTRDLEANSLRSLLKNHTFDHALELGCGTGKNTSFLSSVSTNLTAVDFSEEMMASAKEKLHASNVEFRITDINLPWPFMPEHFNLVSTSLVLEHIENLDFVFSEASRVLKNKGLFYIGELHPYKQYLGSKARFETESGIHYLECYNHHISHFFSAASKNGFTIVNLDEWFDEDEKDIPRVITMLYEKRSVT